MSGDGATIAIDEGGGTWQFGPGSPLVLDSGARIDQLEIAYKTYGRLNEDRSNAVLICHALTLDQHVASTHPTTGKPGWWSTVVGPYDCERQLSSSDVIRHRAQSPSFRGVSGGLPLVSP